MFKVTDDIDKIYYDGVINKNANVESLIETDLYSSKAEEFIECMIASVDKIIYDDVTNRGMGLTKYFESALPVIPQTYEVNRMNDGVWNCRNAKHTTRDRFTGQIVIPVESDFTRASGVQQQHSVKLKFEEYIRLYEEFCLSPFMKHSEAENDAMVFIYCSTYYVKFDLSFIECMKKALLTDNADSSVRGAFFNPIEAKACEDIIRRRANTQAAMIETCYNCNKYSVSDIYFDERFVYEAMKSADKVNEEYKKFLESRERTNA